MGEIMHAQFMSIWPDFVCSGKLIGSFAEGATSSLDEKNLLFIFFLLLLAIYAIMPNLCCTHACCRSDSDTTDGDL